MTTVEQAISTLNRLVQDLSHRQTDVDTFSNAYRGDFGLHYVSDDFKKYFSNRYAKFSDNWCGIVADAPHERLEITGVRLQGETKQDDDLFRRWREIEADALSDLAFLDAIIAKRAYALVWGNGDDEPTVTWEHPSQAIVEYDPETRRRAAGAKIWADDKFEYATLYLRDSVWKFQRSNIRAGESRGSGLVVPASVYLDGAWQERRGHNDDHWPMKNPLGEVPLVEFPNRPRLVGEPHSDIAGTLAMQHSINLLWAQLFTASDYASFPQRVVIGAEVPTVPVLDADGVQIGEREIDLKEHSLKRAHWLEDPNAKIDQWDPAKLDVWTDVIEIAVGHIAAQTRTPAHYLLIGGTIANMSDAAMKTLETGLVERTKEKTQHFGRAAREVFRLMALAAGETEKAKKVSTGTVLWRDVENISEAQLSDALSKKKDIGYPLEYLLELDGVPPTDIPRILAMAKAEREDPLVANLLRPAAGTATQPDVNGDAVNGNAPVGA